MCTATAQATSPLAFTSTATGNWSAASTWSPAGGPPGQDPGDTVALSAGTVTLNSSPTLASITSSGTASCITCGTNQTLTATGNITYTGTGASGMLRVSAGTLTVTTPLLSNTSTGTCMTVAAGAQGKINGTVQNSIVGGTCLSYTGSGSVSNVGSVAIKTLGGGTALAAGLNSVVTITGSANITGGTTGSSYAIYGSGGWKQLTLIGDLVHTAQAGGNSYGIYLAGTSGTINVTGNCSGTGSPILAGYATHVVNFTGSPGAGALATNVGVTTSGVLNWTGTTALTTGSHHVSGGTLHLEGLTLTVPANTCISLACGTLGKTYTNASTSFILQRPKSAVGHSLLENLPITWDMSDGGGLDTRYLLSGANSGTLTLPAVDKVLTTAGSWGIAGTGSTGTYNATQLSSSTTLTGVSWGAGLSNRGAYDVSWLDPANIGVGVSWGVGLANSGTLNLSTGTVSGNYIMTGHGGTLTLPPATKVQAGTVYGSGTLGNSNTGSLYIRRKDQ